MANEDIVKIVKIETDEAQISMADLRKEISTLRDKLLNLDTASEEYKKTCEDINTIQSVITQTMNANKQTAEALEGSYNALSAEMSRLKKEWKATNDEATRNELGQQIAEINNQLKEMDSSIGVFNRNVGDYENAIGNAINKNVSFGDAMSQMQKSTEQTRAKFQSVQKIASGLASGYSALTGVTALLGIENEEFEKTMIKVQSAMSIAQGFAGLGSLIEGLDEAKVAFGDNIKSIKTFIKSLNGVKGALIGTGIGAFVVILGVVIANWEKISKWLGITKDKQIDYNKALEEHNKLSEQVQKNINNEIALLTAKGATQEEIRQYEINEMEARLGDLETEVKTAERIYKNAKGKEREEAKKHYETLLQDYTDYRENYINKVNIYNELTIREHEEQNKAIADAKARAAAEQKKRAEAIAEEARLALIDTEKEELTELERIYEKNKTLLKANQIDTKALEDKYEKEKTEIEQKYAKKREDIAKAEREQKEKDSKELLSGLQSELMAIREKTDDNLFQIDMDIETTDNPLEQIQNEITLIQKRSTAIIDGYDAEIMAMQNKLDNEKLQAEERKQIEADITATINEQNRIRQEAEKETAELNKKLSKEKKQMALQVTQATLSATSNMLGSIAGLFEENSEEYRGMMIAQSVINTISGAITAFTTAMELGPIAGPIVGAINTAAVIASGVANIAKLKSANENTSVSAETPEAPKINIAELMPTQTANRQLSGNEMDELNSIVPTKIYVTETDIEETRRKVQVAETASTF